MEGYRSYPEGRPGYPEGRQEGQPYLDGPSPEPPYPEPRYPESQYGENSGWYAGERGYRDAERFDDTRGDPRTGDPLRGSGSAPPPGAAPGAAPGPSPRPGPRPGDEPSPPRGRPPAAPAAPASPGSPGPVGEGVYRSKRPAVAVLFGVPAGILEIPALVLLADATFGDPASPSGVISAICVILALPLAAFGLYSVATGAVRATAGPNSAQAWLRPPVAYLSVALVLFIAAGLAA